MTTERPRSPRKPGRPRDTQVHETILEATRELIKELGYNKTTMEKIASRSGVSRATLYRWWQTKGQLVIEATMAVTQLPLEKTTGHFKTDFEGLVTTTTNNLVSAHNLDAIMGLEYDARYDAVVYKTLSESRVDSTTKFREVIKAAKAAGKLPEAVDEDTLFHLIYGGTIMMANHSKSLTKKRVATKMMAFFEALFEFD